LRRNWSIARGVECGMDRKLVVLAGVMLGVIVLGGWLTTSSIEQVAEPLPVPDTIDVLTQAAGISPQDFSFGDEDQMSIAVLDEDRMLIALAPQATTRSEWLVHLAGLAAETFGVFLSFYLARAAGMIPRRLRGQILGLSLVLGVASYATANAAALVTPPLSPQVLLGSIKDGFVWAAAFPMFANAFGMADESSERARAGT